MRLTQFMDRARLQRLWIKNPYLHRPPCLIRKTRTVSRCTELLISYRKIALEVSILLIRMPNWYAWRKSTTRWCSESYRKSSNHWQPRPLRTPRRTTQSASWSPRRTISPSPSRKNKAPSSTSTPPLPRLSRARNPRANPQTRSSRPMPHSTTVWTPNRILTR